MLFRKRRRISYKKRAKEQRMKLYIILAALGILFVFSLGTLADTGVHEVTVIADTGDTLWTLCEPYCPEGMDLRLFIDKVMYENNLKSSGLSIGQEVVIPLD
ncbi:MAG: LysM peptidoglycan-binding domain-containing protein [Clostridia bacterium]|nr:LysM peptidoglycan-binding domain-containing protein [Clostridia bacterium]